MKKILLALIILLAIGMTYASTYRHIGADPDTTVYVGVAKNWSAGRGLTMPVIGGPLTHYPPLYPLILSASTVFGIDMLRWALWLDFILVVANILLAERLAAWLGIRNTLLPAALIGLCPGILTVHWMAWTEPPFLFLTFTGLLAVAAYLREEKPWLLYAAGVIFALAWLDRYIGAALVAGVCGGLWLFSRRRVRDLLIFGLAAATPMLLWLAFNALRYGNVANRRIGFRPLLPVEGVVLVLELVIAGGVYLFIRRKKAGPLPHLLVLTLFAYVAVLAFTVCLADAATPVLDTRIQAPVMFGVFLLLPWLAATLQPRTAKLFSALLVALVLIQLAGSLAYTAVSYTEGLDFSNGSWSQENISIPAHPWY